MRGLSAAVNLPTVHEAAAAPSQQRFGGKVLCFDGRPEVVALMTAIAESSDLLVATTDLVEDALQLLQSTQWDVLLVDPVLALGRGRAFVRHAQTVAPRAVVAAFCDLVDPELAPAGIVALNLTGSDLQRAMDVARLLEGTRAANQAAPEVILAIGAHPDDVEIGVGGTLLAHGAAGHRVAILTLSKGARGGEIAVREVEAADAAGRLGAQLFLEDLEDTMIEAGAPTVGMIERVIEIVQPTTIYTHSIHDTHQDHRAVHRATLVAGRRVGKIACYQSPSATIDFRPNRFVPVADQLDAKLDAISAYRSQIDRCAYLAEDVLSSTTRYWSRFSTSDHAEALEVVRDASALGAMPASSSAYLDVESS